jgi:acyl-CoA thioesterase I
MQCERTYIREYNVSLHLFFAYLGVIVAIMFTYILVEVLIIKYSGIPVSAPDIPRTPQTSGSGPKLTYVVMGDSTAIGQGGVYDKSYAVKSAAHLSRTYNVTLINTGVSGARAQDVLDTQLDKIKNITPDVVLLGVGANDTTHFTDLDQLKRSLQQIITELMQINPNVRIVLTRSPALDSVSRFPPLSKLILGQRTKQVNQVFDEIIMNNNLTPALIAEKTRTAFLDDPTLTASDKFHPNERGYALWVPIINDALDSSLSSTK